MLFSPELAMNNFESLHTACAATEVLDVIFLLRYCCVTPKVQQYREGALSAWTSA